jgi:hypothetical protein
MRRVVQVRIEQSRLLDCAWEAIQNPVLKQRAKSS